MTNQSATTEIEKIFVVTNSWGLHLRPAQTLVQALTPLDCEVWISKIDLKPPEEVNGKSILGIAMLEAIQGTKLKFRVVGPQAKQALKIIDDLFTSNFGECYTNGEESSKKSG